MIGDAAAGTEVVYGSDPSGLVWAYLFCQDEPPRATSCDAALARLSSAGDDSPFVWLHFNISIAGCESWLRSHLALPDVFYDSVHHGRQHASSSTRIEIADDALVAVLNDIQFFALDTTDAATVTICADPQLLISARTTPLRSVDRLRAAVKGGERFRSTAELVAHLLRDQADVLADILREATARVDRIEDQLFTGSGYSNRPVLGSMRRVLVRLQRLLAPEPAALFRLLTRPPSWIAPPDLSDLRQSAEELSAAVTDSVALVERVRLLQEELLALVNEQTNRTLFVLTVVTVLALPFTIITGLLGMNIGGLPFRDHDSGFALVLGGLVLCTAAGAWFAFGRRQQ